MLLSKFHASPPSLSGSVGVITSDRIVVTDFQSRDTQVGVALSGGSRGIVADCIMRPAWIVVCLIGYGSICTVLDSKQSVVGGVIGGGSQWWVFAARVFGASDPNSLAVVRASSTSTRGCWRIPCAEVVDDFPSVHIGELHFDRSTVLGVSGSTVSEVLLLASLSTPSCVSVIPGRYRPVGRCSDVVSCGQQEA